VMLQICHDPTHQKGSFMVDHTTKGWYAVYAFLVRVNR
jgi:hypothetical protein